MRVMTLRILFSILCLFLTASVAGAQSAGATRSVPDGDESPQNETMLDTLKRMQIKREEEEHKKILDKGVKLERDAESLAKEAANGHLPHASEKKLRDIEKAARQIRSEFG